MNTLTKTDFKILNTINNNSLIHRDNLLQLLPDKKFATSARLASLINIYILEERTPYTLENPRVEHVGFYLSSKGEIVLSDYNLKSKHDLLKQIFYIFPLELMRSFAFPLVIAYLTTLLAYKKL